MACVILARDSLSKNGELPTLAAANLLFANPAGLMGPLFAHWSASPLAKTPKSLAPKLWVADHNAVTTPTDVEGYALLTMTVQGRSGS
jgi:hypothetical protein